MFARPMSFPSWFNGGSQSDTGDQQKPEQDDPYEIRLKLKQLVDTLIDAGISISLPQVIVAGSQSSGKSCLFEGIAEVSLPRNEGTCTRCPIICRLSCKPGIDWRCRVWLLRSVHTNGSALQYSKKIPFGPFMLREEEVGDRILRAQKAILHPDQDPEIFLTASEFEEQPRGLPGKEFSSDSILVEIEGPEVKDLSFVDLPGIIVDDEEVENVEQVRKLVTKFAADDSCLILVVYSCADDKRNQGAGRLAKDHDPTGKRTIVALTKPDLIQGSEAEERWLNMIRESSNRFCVRQTSIHDIRSGMSRDQARSREMEFFQTVGNWPSLYHDPSTQHRLGTKNLRNYLNIRLLDWIVERAPQMQADLKRHLRETEDSLNRLPESIEDPVAFTDTLLSEFGDKLSAAVDIHNFDDPELVSTCRSRLDTFSDKLMYHLFPRFCAIGGTRTAGPKLIEFEEFPATLNQTFKPTFPSGSVPETIFLDDLMEQSVKTRSRQLPWNFPYGVLKRCTEKAIEVWRDPTESMLEEVFVRISDALNELVSEHFGSLKSGRPAGLVWEVVNQYIESRRKDVRETLLASLEREKTSSQVYGCWEFLHHKNIYLKHYHSQFRPGKDRAFLDGALDAISFVAPRFAHAAKLATSTIRDAMKTEDDTITGEPATDSTEPTPYQPLSMIETNAIDIMAQTRAFYHMAVRRYAEGAAQIICHDLLLNLKGDIKGGPNLMETLRREIGVFGRDAEENCNAFLEPSQEARKLRIDLEQRNQLIQGVLKELDAIKKQWPLSSFAAGHERSPMGSVG